jgi:hypothetical protein
MIDNNHGKDQQPVINRAPSYISFFNTQFFLGDPLIILWTFIIFQLKKKQINQYPRFEARKKIRLMSNHQ